MSASEAEGGARAVAACGARTRTGRPCRARPVTGRRRCRMHGGAFGSGAQRGNRNALKHGRTTAAALERRRRLRMLVARSNRLLTEVEAMHP